MVISKKDIVPRAHILLNGECLEQVNQFTYLGQLITDDGYCDRDKKAHRHSAGIVSTK